MFGFNSRKGQVGGLASLQSIVMGLVVIGILFGAGLLALSSFSDSLDDNSTEQNATENVVEGVANIAEKLPTMGILIGVAAIILGAFLIFQFMGSRF